MISACERKRKKVIAWIAIGLSAIFANFWAYWGINENFHEGWYSVSFWDNILMMFGQYLLVPIGFILLAFISIKWNRIGSICNLILAVGAFYFFRKTGAGFLLVASPLAGLAILYWFGRLESRRFAYFFVCGLPLLQMVGIGTYHSIRIVNRYNDGNFNTRLIKGNGIELMWAPQGPGWPDNGTTWFEAKRI